MNISVACSSCPIGYDGSLFITINQVLLYLHLFRYLCTIVYYICVLAFTESHIAATSVTLTASTLGVVATLININIASSPLMMIPPCPWITINNSDLIVMGILTRQLEKTYLYQQVHMLSLLYHSTYYSCHPIFITRAAIVLASSVNGAPRPSPLPRFVVVFFWVKISVLVT